MRKGRNSFCCGENRRGLVSIDTFSPAAPARRAAADLFPGRCSALDFRAIDHRWRGAAPLLGRPPAAVLESDLYPAVSGWTRGACVMDEQSSEAMAMIEEASAEYLGKWNRLVSTTNWEKGRIICQWREALEEAGAGPG